MKVTAAICTWNRAALLDQTLAAMHQLRIPEGVTWELLVVNNNCTDDTDDVIARHSSALPLRRLHEPISGLSHARNRALEEVRGELLAWTDDDVLVDPDWLTSLVAAATRFPTAAAFGGAIRPWFPVDPDPDLYAAFPALRNGFCCVNHELPEGPLPQELPVYGANLAFRMDSIREERFNTAIGMKPSGPNGQFSVGGGDEREFLNRLRSRDLDVIWVPSMRVKHYVCPWRMTEEYLLKYSRECGATRVRMGEFPGSPRFLGVPRWVYRELVEDFLRASWYQLASMNARRLEARRRLEYLIGAIKEIKLQQS